MANHKIAIDARFYHTGSGVARYLKNFLHELTHADTHNHYTIIVRPESVDELEKDKPSNWTVVGLDIPHYSLAEQTVFLRYLNKQKFDLVYFTMFNHPILYQGKFVVMIHDVIMHIYPPRPLWHPRTWVYRYVMWHAAQKSRAIITNSVTTQNDVVKWLGVPNSKCHPILLAVEESFKPASSKDVEAVKAKFKITKPYLLFLNAWRPHKGLPELVEAFRHINGDGKYQLVLGGKPDPRFPNVIKSVEAGQSSDIIRPGFLSDTEMMALLTGCELYVNPSHYEGFGLGVLEAMACGAPVLCSDTPCFKEIGRDAVDYFKTKSAGDLAQKTTLLLNDKPLRENLIKKGDAHLKNFSFKTLAHQTLEVFNSILNK